MILAVLAIGAVLWIYREPRPLPSPLRADDRFDDYDRTLREWKRLGTDGLRAKLEAMADRRAKLDKAAERERKQEQLRRQRIYFVALLALFVIVAGLRLYLRRVRRYRAASDERSPPD